MTDGERQRQIDFIIMQQAQFAADRQAAETRQQAAERRLDRLERVVKLAVRAGLRTRREVRDQIAALVDAHLRTEDAMARMAEAQAHTDKRLDALIDVVQGKRNGHT